MTLKKATLAGILLASAALSMPAMAQSTAGSSVTQTANSEFPGGIRADNSSDAQLNFLGLNKNVSRLRLTQGTTRLTVPSGKELKLEVGSLLVQAKDNAELEATFDASGKPQITCFAGLVGVTDSSGNHFRLGTNSVLTMGADGLSPTVRARSTAVAAPAPAPSAPVVTAPPAPAPSVAADEDYYEEPQPEQRRRRPAPRDEEDNYTYQPPRSQGPSVGDMILQNIPTILGTVLPYMLNRNQPQFPGYYPGPGYYPNGGYYPNTGFPNGGGYIPFP